MDENETDVIVTPKDQFAKLMLGTALAFAASKLVEVGYDKYVVDRRNSATENE